MKEIFEKLFAEYEVAKQESKSGHEMANYLENIAPQILYNTGLIDEVKYKVQGSAGRGRWADIPWIAILDKSITETVQNGVYIIYLLAKDRKSIYLTLNQGYTEIKRLNPMKGKRILKANAETHFFKIL